MIEAHNLGAQVPNERLIEYAEKVDADAILVCQVVTQKDVHIAQPHGARRAPRGQGRARALRPACAGGPRIGNKLAVELGFDAGFGQGTYADHVATFLIERLGVKHQGVRS